MKPIWGAITIESKQCDIFKIVFCSNFDNFFRKCLHDSKKSSCIVKNVRYPSQALFIKRV